MFTLIYQDGEEWHRRTLPAGVVVLGRSAECEVSLTHPSVSRRHARIEVAGGTCRITDLQSTLFTYVNGRRVSSATLKDRDVVTLGQLSLTVEETPDVSVSDLPAVLDPHGAVHLRAGPRPDTDASPAEGPADGAAAERLVTLLADATGTLALTHDRKVVLDRVVTLIFDVVPAERVFVLLLDPQSGEIVPRVARGRGGADPGAATISRTVVKHVMADRTAMLSIDVPTDLRLDGALSLQVQGVRSFMCAPLWTGQDVFGVIYADTRRFERLTSRSLAVFTTVCNYVSVALDQMRLSAQLAQEMRRRENLERYHSPVVAERIAREAEPVLLANAREVTVLFGDLVGFTAMSERMAASDVADLLNGFFSAMTDVIFANEGTLDKFIGDGVLAVFGAPLDQPDHAERGVRAACQMREALARYNERRGYALQMRIGVNSGVALVGDFGALRRREFTVLGDVVNTAARLQTDVCTPGKIVISEATYRLVSHAFMARPLGTVTVKGRAGEITVFEL